jgi:beta-galactosidase
VVFFRWRSCLFGTEQYWHGVLNHDGKPRRRYWALRDFGREVTALSEAVDGTCVRSEVAILNSYEQHYAFQIQPQAEGLDIWQQAGRYYRALRKRGLNVDIVPISVDLTQYKLIVLPSWHVIEESDAARLKSYVQEGGTLVVSARSGVKNSENVCLTEPLPAMLSEVVGLEVDDYDPLGAAEIRVATPDGRVYQATCWADALSLKGAESLATYAEGAFQGEPAVAKHRFGAGVAFYLGTFGDSVFCDDFVASILDTAGVEAPLNVSADVDVSWREREGVKLLFLLNLSGEDRAICVTEQVAPLLGAPVVDGSIQLAPYGVGIYQALGVAEALEADVEDTAFERV